MEEFIDNDQVQAEIQKQVQEKFQQEVEILNKQFESGAKNNKSASEWNKLNKQYVDDRAKGIKDNIGKKEINNMINNLTDKDKEKLNNMTLAKEEDYINFAGILGQKLNASSDPDNIEHFISTLILNLKTKLTSNEYADLKQKCTILMNDLKKQKKEKKQIILSKNAELLLQAQDEEKAAKEKDFDPDDDFM